MVAQGSIHAGSGDDHVEIRGGSAIYGEGGNDYIAYAAGQEDFGSMFALGGDGADTILGGNSGDTLGTADLVLVGGSYQVGDDLALDHDVIRAGGGEDVVSGGYGDDLDGGAGYDYLRLSFGGLQTGIAFDAGIVSGGHAATIGGGVVQNFEALVYLRATDFNDTLTLAAQSRTDIYSGITRDQLIEVHAGGGDDLIVGANSFANVYGEAGDDRFVSGNTPDVFDGGAGTDTIDYSGYGSSVTVNLFSGSGADSDRLISVENVIGSAHDDTLIGSAAANVLTGGAGADTLTGGSGLDSFRDTLAGHAGDTITDLANGETIVFTDADLSTFNYSATATTLTYQGGTIALAGFSAVTFTASAAAGGGVSLTLTASEASNHNFRSASDPLLANFNAANGWSSQDLYPRHAADLNGDDRADLVGFGAAGVLVSTNQNGSFGQPALVLADFGQQQGWTSDNRFHRTLADLNGDGRADIVGFGFAGTLTSLAQRADSFTAAAVTLNDFGQRQGWSSQDRYARFVGDVNGDGKGDIVGFGIAGTLVALGNGDGTFHPVKLGLEDFGTDQGWTSQNLFTRALADVNGDGKDDIVGFGMAGTYVALSNGDGTFADPELALDEFGTAQGWRSDDLALRLVGDVNGDGLADIVGFTSAGTVIALGNGDGTFQSPRADVADFGAGQGWTSDNSTPRELADFNGDGFLGIVGFGKAGVLAGYNELGFIH